MATREDIIQAIRNADAAGDSASVRKLAAFLKRMPAPQEQSPDPTEGMSATELGLAGVGKAFTDVARGGGQLLRKVLPDRAADAIGLPTQQDIDEAKATDAALMNTTAGKVGNVVGSVAVALPTAFIPGAQGFAGATATGAGLGLIQPVATGESRLQNAAVGAGAGAAGVVAGRVLAAGAKGAQALVDPFTSKGRTKIAGRTLSRFGVRPQDVAGTSSAPTVTGAVPTLAEQIADPAAAQGAARLQDAMRAADPEIAGQFAAREVQNNAARVNTLRDLAGHDGAREFADASRQTAAKELYGKAFAVKMPPAKKPVQAYHGTASEFDQFAPSTKNSTWGPQDNAGTWFTSSADDANRFARMKTPGDTGVGANIRPVRIDKPDKVIDLGPGFRISDRKAAMKEMLEDKSVNVVKFVTHGDDATSKDVVHYWVRNEAVPKAVASEFEKGLSAAERGEITKLMNMPAIKEAMKGAQTIAKNQGKSLGKPDGSIEGLHNMKLALDDQINSLMGGSAAEVNKAMSIKAARDRLVTFIERMSPEYGEARVTYAAMSKPLNQMDVADALFRKGTSATSDLGGNPRLMPEKFVKLLKNEEATVKGATGRDLGKLSDLLEPDQFNKVMAVGKELDRASAVGRAANGPGSATAQRMSSQNILRQVLGPTGLPESWAESTLLNTMMRPVQFMYSGVAEPKIQAVLSDLLLNPDKARAVLQLAQTSPRRLPAEVQAALPYLEQAMRTALPAAAVSGQ